MQGMHLFRQNLKWLLSPPTLTMWANWYFTMWDSFILGQKEYNGPRVLYMSSSEESYKKYHQIMQLLDMAFLDANYMLYNSRILVLSALYVMLSYDVGTIIGDGGLLFVHSDFNELYDKYLIEAVGFLMNDIRAGIEFLCPLMKNKFESTISFEENVGHIEVLQSFQTHNRMNVEYIREMYKTL